ncbi:MAG: ATP-binding cassette domain-containing protein [Haloplanus sp.]
MTRAGDDEPTSDDAPAVALDDVTVTLGGTTVLDGVSTTVERGAFVGLVGPNGAGKTTLLRSVNGLLAPDSGTVHVAGDRVADLSSRATSRRVATVPQSTAVSFAFDVREAVAMGRTPHVGRFGTRTETDRRAVDAAMERTDVAHLADRLVTDVSGGERQRVFLARALAQETSVLLLDEPTSDLDVNHQVRTLDLASNLADEGRTVVAAIHDLDLAARFCDDLRLLYDGRIHASGPPDEVLTGAAVADAFDTAAAVTDHPVTRSASVTAFADASEGSGRVHVVGGGDAATPHLVRLDAAGYDCSLGAVSADSTDAATARRLDCDLVTVPPYAPVDDDAHAAVAAHVRAADAVLVADVAVSEGNLPVLRAAARGPDLVVVDGLGERNFAGDDGRRVADALRRRATVADAGTLLDAVARAVDAEGDADASLPWETERVGAED